MLGADAMSMKETNIALLSTIPEEFQSQIYNYLTKNFCKTGPFAPRSADEIYSDLAAAREYTARGMYEDFDDALDDISARYEL